MATALVAMVAAGVLACVVGMTRLTSPPPLVEATAMTRALAAPAFLVAGVLRLARWRITGEQHLGLRGAAMLVLGGISLPSTVVALRLLESPTTTCIRALTIAVVLSVVAVALTGGRVGQRELGRRFVWVMLGTAVVTGLVVAAQARVSAAPPLQVAVAQGLEAALAVAWLTLTVTAWVAGRHQDWARSAAPLLAAMGVAELLRLPERSVPTLVAVAVTAAVGLLAASSALVDLVRAAQEKQRETQALSLELAHVRDEVSTHDAWRADLTHDARSTLAGIRAAMHTLDRHADDLDPAAADRLRVATFAELSHLEQMLEHRSPSVDVFDVADVVRTVTDVRRAAGLRIEVTPCSARVHGAPADLATALQNLLVNAQDHASGATVRVVVRTVADQVEIVVADDGPGIPAGRGGDAFERGVRGLDSHGSGLGLPISRALMRRHGGDLALCPTERGTTFVVSLPLAVPTALTDPIAARAAS